MTQSGQLLSRHSLPDARVVVGRHGDDPLAIGAKTCGQLPALIAAQHGHHPSRCSVPDARAGIVTHANDASTIWAKPRIVRLPRIYDKSKLINAEPLPMFLRRKRIAWVSPPGDPFSRRRVQDARLVVVRCRYYQLPIGAERCTAHRRIRLISKLCNLWARCRIPDPRSAIARRGHDPSPIWLKDALLILPMWPFKTAICLPMTASQMRAVVSEDAVTIRSPSGLKEASTTPVWPANSV